MGTGTGEEHVVVNKAAEAAHSTKYSLNMIECMVSLSANHPNIVRTLKVVTQSPGRKRAALLSSLI
jgi:hypothetical protein